MKRNFLLLSLILMLGGCAMDIRTTGYLDRTQGIQALQKGASFAVLENAQAPNPILDKEIKRKIEKWLVTHGYRTAAPDQANYYLTFHYAIIPGLQIGTATSYGPLQTQVVPVPDGKGGTTWRTVTVPGPTSTVTTITEAYTKQLTLRVLDAQGARNGKKDNVIWVGDTLSTDSSSDLRYALDYLLVATFRYFGQDTGKQVNISLGNENREVKELRNE